MREIGATPSGKVWWGEAFSDATEGVTSLSVARGETSQLTLILGRCLVRKMS